MEDSTTYNCVIVFLVKQKSTGKLRSTLIIDFKVNKKALEHLGWHS